MLDRYSKAVLTVIAAALIALIAQNWILPVSAEDPKIVRAVICDPYNIQRCARVFQDGNEGEYSNRNFLHTR